MNFQKSLPNKTLVEGGGDCGIAGKDDCIVEGQQDKRPWERNKSESTERTGWDEEKREQQPPRQAQARNAWDKKRGLAKAACPTPLLKNSGTHTKTK